MSLLAARRDRSCALVLRLEADRVAWIGRYIEWHALGLLPEARLALENLRAVRRQLRRALRLASFWFWLTKGSSR